MAPQAGETLADLINAAAGTRGRGGGMTFDDLAKRSIDPDSGYQPSGSMLWRVARDEGVKINPPLVRAIAAGLRLPQDRVEAAAHRQYIGPYAAVDPGLGAGGDDDEVIRVARPANSTAGDTTEVEEFVRRSRADDASDQG